MHLSTRPGSKRPTLPEETAKNRRKDRARASWIAPILTALYSLAMTVMLIPSSDMRVDDLKYGAVVAFLGAVAVFAMRWARKERLLWSELIFSVSVMLLFLQPDGIMGWVSLSLCLTAVLAYAHRWNLCGTWEPLASVLAFFGAFLVLRASVLPAPGTITLFLFVAVLAVTFMGQVFEREDRNAVATAP